MFTQSTNPFFNLYAEKISWKVVFGWMDKITKTKRVKILFTYEVQCIITNNLNKISVCCRCSLPSWLLVGCNCQIQGCWSCAIVTTITTILVWCKCNKKHRWLDTALTNMNAGPVLVYQTCMLVGASLTDMTSG